MASSSRQHQEKMEKVCRHVMMRSDEHILAYLFSAQLAERLFGYSVSVSTEQDKQTNTRLLKTCAIKSCPEMITARPLQWTMVPRKLDGRAEHQQKRDEIRK